MTFHGSYVSAFIGLAVCIGCGKATIDVDAQVTLDGQPVEGASVTLVSIDEAKNRLAVGISGADGKVRFTTFEADDGVLPGRYKVLVSKMPKSMEEEFANFNPDDLEDVKRMQQRERSAIVAYTPSSLPRIYLNVAETPLSLKVPPDEEPVVFALESSAGKRK